jgi:ankyrin repeat protein
MTSKSLELIFYINHVSICLAFILYFLTFFFVVDLCLSCNTNKRSFTEFEETDEVHFNDLTLNRMDTQVMDLSHIRNVITAARMPLTIKSVDQFSSLENAIQQGNIDLAIKFIKKTKNCLERENNDGETPLLLAGKYNQDRLVVAILKKRPDLAKKMDKQGNNLLHLLANISDNRAKQTIEKVFMLLDDNMKEFLIFGVNQRRQTPEQIAKNRGNMEYIDLFNLQIHVFDDNQ